MKDIQKIAIEVQKIEDSADKITLFEQTGEQKYPTKYSFFKKTQAGTESKAYTQFQELGVEAGKVYQIAVKETKGVNKVSGKEVTYRNIAFFYTGDTSNIPEPFKTSPAGNSGLTELSNRLDNASKAFMIMSKKIETLEKEVEGLKGALITEENEKAFEFHKEVTAKIKDQVFGEDNIPIIK